MYLTLPEDLINTQWKNLPENAAIELIMSRMRWDDVSEHRIRIVSQNNLDCIFDIDGDLESEDESKRFLSLKSVVKVDNLYTDFYRNDSPHYFHQPYSLRTDQVRERLIRMNQNYKTVMQHAMNLRTFAKEADLKAFMLE